MTSGVPADSAAFPPLSCREALAALISDPGVVSPSALRHARLHTEACPNCAGVLEDSGPPERNRDRLPARTPVAVALRITLGVLAVAQILLALPWLFGGSVLPDPHVAAAHLTRDGALGVIVGTAGIIVAFRPRHAFFGAIVGVVVITLQSLSGVVDQRDQAVDVGFELAHLLLVMIVILIVFVAASVRRATPGAIRSRRPIRSV